MDNATLSRKTLGRGAALCDLYDIRQDQFCGISLLRSAPPEATVTSLDVPDIFTEYTSEHTYHDKFHNLSVEAALRISVLGGLFSLSGSGNYLNDESSSQKVVRGTLIYKITTKEDRINLLHEDLSPFVLTAQLSKSEATHVVSKIRWGANVFVTFEKKVHDYSKRKEIAGTLRATLTQVTNEDISGGGRGQYLDKDTHGVDTFSIKVQGDVVPDGQPTPQSVEEVSKFLSMIPQYVKKFNGGKGKPLEIELFPIKLLALQFGIAIKEDKLKSDLDLASIGNVESEIDSIVRQKQILNDFVAEVTDFSEHVMQKDLVECIQYQQRVSTADAEFRATLKKAILAIRQNGAPTSILDGAMQNYHLNPDGAHGIPVFMDKKSVLKEKMDFVQAMREKNVDFLPKSKSIGNFVTRHDSGDLYVLYHSQELQHTEKCRMINLVFLDKIKERNEAIDTMDDNVAADLTTNTAKFLVVDVALHPRARGGNNSVGIARYSNGRLVTDDVVTDIASAVTQNIIFWKRIDKFGSPPQKVATVEHLICPLATQSKCKAERRLWVCHRCNQTMLYALGDHFYCNCGGVLIQDCKFKCCDPHHGSQFASFVSPEMIKKQLRTVLDSDSTNILLLGETGVGKTTWINALRNYLEYPTLHDAMTGGVKVVIPSSFMQGSIKIPLGEPDSQEASTTSDGAGQSSTQSCRSHYFMMGPRKIQIIDTPGIGDVRGIEQDKHNTEHILEYLGNEDQLHGICILLKPNESRLSYQFKFCLTSLLTNLHKHAANNIMFCYTNARATLYHYGDTHALVEDMLRDIKRFHGQKVPYNESNTFFFDSESFRLLACIQHGMQFPPKSVLAFSDSWDTSVEETFRLLDAIVKVEPHVIAETVSLNDARKLITMLSRPLAEIANTITNNTISAQQQKANIMEFKNLQDQLQACLWRDVEVLDIIELPYPRTVCTSKSCTSTVNSVVEYPTCHDRCGGGGRRDMILCKMMDWGGACRICRCDYTVHQRITYDSRRVQKKEKDEAIQKQINEKMSTKEIVLSTLKQLEKDIQEMEDEKKKISKASAGFAVFLKENAITPFNDSIDHYLKQMIEQRRDLGQIAEMESLETLREEYQREKDLYEENLAASVNSQSSTTHRPLRVEDIQTVLAEIEKLPRSGPSLRRQMQVSKQCLVQFQTHHRGSTYSRPKLTTDDRNWLRQKCTLGLSALKKTLQF